MKLGIYFAKVIALVLSTVLFTSNVSSEQISTVDNKIESCAIVETDLENTANMMEIECPHCHEHITVDINKTNAQCPHCGHTCEFAG